MWYSTLPELIFYSNNVALVYSFLGSFFPALVCKWPRLQELSSSTLVSWSNSSESSPAAPSAVQICQKVGIP